MTERSSSERRYSFGLTRPVQKKEQKLNETSTPIERIDRLRFRFRYHDGRLVDFKCLPFSFTLEFNMLRDEQLRSYLVRVPPLYCL